MIANHRAEAVAALLLLLVSFTPSAPGDDITTITAVATPTQHDESPILSSLPAHVPTEKGAGPLKLHRVKPLPPLPERVQFKGQSTPLARTVEQTAASFTLSITPIEGFAGIGDGKAYRVEHAPSDTAGAIGDTQYVQWVNEALQIFDRNGSSQYGPTLGNTLWKGFTGNCQDLNDGDPIVQYDKLAGHWLLSQFAYRHGPPFFQCVAVSQTSDARGKYFRYAFSFPKFNDYPKIAVWPSEYYFSFNMFEADETPIGSKICALNRADVIAGKATIAQCFDVPSFGVLPADFDGMRVPPMDGPAYAMSFTRDALLLWEIRIDWKDITKSRMTGPKVIKVAPFEEACPNRQPCIPQPPPEPGADAPLFSLGDRLMYRVVYRNFGDYESLLLDHSVATASGQKQPSGIRWYEIRNPRAAKPLVRQQSTYAIDGLARWLGSIGMDKEGNMLVGFSASSSKLFPAIRLAGRSAGDTVNMLSREINVVSGKATALGGSWGDYSTMSIDPTDDCTFWFTTEYMGSVDDAWQTYIAHTKFRDCK